MRFFPSNKNKNTSAQPDSSRDAELIRRYRGGDEQAFNLLVADHLDAVYSFITRYVSGGETEDIVQDVFIKVWKNLDRFDLSRNFRTWLFTIAKNTALDWLKKKKPVAFSDLAIGDETGPAYEDTLAADDPLPGDLFDQSQSQEVLAAALETLPVDYRAVVLLRLDAQLTFREIAETLDRPLNTVKSHYRRALSILQRELGAASSGIPPRRTK